MTRRIVFATIFAALLGTVPGRTAGVENPEAKAVNAAFDRYVLGWQKGDIEMLSTSYSHDVRMTAYWPDPVHPLRIEGWDTLRKNLVEVFDLIKRMDLDFDQRKIDVYGEAAVLTTRWTWRRPSNPFFEHGRGTFIFKKEAGKWVIVHEHSSVTPFIPGGDSEILVKDSSR